MEEPMTAAWVVAIICGGLFCLYSGWMGGHASGWDGGRAFERRLQEAREQELVRQRLEEHDIHNVTLLCRTCGRSREYIQDQQLPCRRLRLVKGSH